MLRLSSLMQGRWRSLLKTGFGRRLICVPIKTRVMQDIWDNTTTRRIGAQQSSVGWQTVRVNA